MRPWHGVESIRNESTNRFGNPDKQARTPNRGRRLFRWVRLTILVLLLAGAIQLRRWNREGDPRFYAFCESVPGQVVSRVFGWWGSPLERPPVDKPNALFTPEEREIRQKIEEALRIAAREDDRSDWAPTVRYRDVAFRSEFSAFRLAIHPPFAVLSDADPADVEDLLAHLKVSHRGFVDMFRPLFRKEGGDELIHLLYFRGPEAYSRYQENRASDMAHTTGLYSPTADRLVLFRQATRPESTSTKGTSEDQTVRTIRHEAAHQFLFAHGVHSAHRIENDWLLEGLASYCETAQVGDIDPAQRSILAGALRTQNLLPLQELVNHRGESGLLGYKAAELAYGQAWSLVHFLMQPTHRDAFFAYVRHIRDPEQFRAIRNADRFDLLAARLGMKRGDLLRAWRAYVETLAGGSGFAPEPAP